MSIHPSVLKEGQNYSTPGFRSNRKLHQHAVCERVATPYQEAAKTTSSLQCGQDKEQEWRHWTLHRPGNADWWPKSMAQIFPHWSSRPKGHPGVSMVHHHTTQHRLGLRMDWQQPTPTHPMHQNGHWIMDRPICSYPSRPKETTKTHSTNLKLDPYCMNYHTSYPSKETNPGIKTSRTSGDTNGGQKDPS